MKKRLGRPKSIENAISRSINFPQRVLDHYAKVAEKQGSSISNAVVEALEKNMPSVIHPLPNNCFGEFQLD